MSRRQTVRRGGRGRTGVVGGCLAVVALAAYASDRRRLACIVALAAAGLLAAAATGGRDWAAAFGVEPTPDAMGD